MKIHIKSCLSLVLAASLAFAAAGCSDQKGSGGTDTVFWTAPMSVKYMLEETPDLKYGEDPSIEMSKNETESVQLIVTPSRNVSSYDVSVGELKNGENTIPSENVQVYAEHYVKVTQPTSTAPVGYYPDAMVPLGYVKTAGEDKIKRGQNQAFVIQVRTAEDTQAGTYTAPVTVRLGGETVKKTLTVKVWDYAISTATHTKTAFAVWDDQLVYGHYEVTPELIETYYEFFNDYRVTPLNLPNVNTLSAEEQAEKVFEYASREDVSGINLPYTTVSAVVPDGDYAGRTYSTFDKTRMDMLLRELVKKEKTANLGILNKLYVYMGALDEPTAANYYIVREANNDFMLLKQSIASDETLLPGGRYEQIKQDLLNIEFVITTPINETLYMDREAGDYHGVDTWCPQFDNFSTEEDRALAEERKAAGDHVWWYGCLTPTNPYPTYHVDDSLAGARVLNWMMMDYGIEGNLYWSTNIYSYYDKSVLSYVYRDIWKNPLAFPGANGDGYLVYPGYKYGYAGPLPTIRLEAIRDGLEDYESLYLLRELSEQIAASFGIRFDFNDSIRNLYELLYSGATPTADEQRILFARRQIAELIEAASDGVLTVYERNDKTNKITAKVYAPAGVSGIAVNGKTLTESAVNGGKVCTAEFVASADECFYQVSYTVGEEQKSFGKFIGGKVTVLNSFDSSADLNAVSVTDGDEYDEIADTEVSLASENAVSGNSLKISLQGIQGNESYRPAVSFENISFGADAAGMKFYVYNASDRKISLDVRLSGDALTSDVYNLVLNAKSGRTVTFRLSDAVQDLSVYDEIRFVFGHQSEGQSALVYLDNLCVTGEAYDPLDDVPYQVSHSDEEFGNYVDSDSEGQSFERAEGVLFDFEEIESVFHNIQYRYVNPSLSIVHDEKYVTSLKGAMRLVVNGQPESGPNYCPAITFKFEGDDTAMQKAKKIVVDVTVEADRDLNLGFNLYFTSGLRTDNSLITIKPGKQQFVFDLEAQHRIMRSSGTVTDYLTDAEKNISGAEIWMNNLAVEETPFVLVFDNLRLVY